MNKMNETQESRSSKQRIAMLLHELTLAYHRFTVMASRERTVGVTDLLALGYLRDKGALTAGALGESLGLASASMTALLDRLERAGYARRQPNANDRRSVMVALTAAGRAEVGTLFDLLGSDVATALKDTSPTELEVVARFLDEITNCFDRRFTMG